MGQNDPRRMQTAACLARPMATVLGAVASRMAEFDGDFWNASHSRMAGSNKIACRAGTPPQDNLLRMSEPQCLPAWQAHAEVYSMLRPTVWLSGCREAQSLPASAQAFGQRLSGRL